MRGALAIIAIKTTNPINAIAMCDVASNPIGGAWSERGVILFSPGSGGPLHRVDASGGKPVPVTSLDTAARETTHRWPRFLPDGEHVLYLAASHDLPEMAETNAIYLAKLGSPERKLLLRARANVEYANGHLFFVRQNTLYAQAFDAEAGELQGQPRAIATDVDYNVLPMLSVFSVGAGRELVFATAGPQRKRRLVWLDREGKVLQTIADADHYLEGSLSRDGETLLATIEDPSVGNDLWLHDLSTNALTRLTLGGTGEQGVWSPDGTRIVHADGKGHIYLRGVGDAAEPALIWSMDGGWGGPATWSPDGKYVTVWRFAPGSPNSYDALLLSLDDRKTVPLAATTASEFPGHFSPDGRWLTYTSNASGRDEIYVVSFPDLAVRRQVSSVGGYEAVWIGPREIWFQRAGGSVFSTTLLESPNGTVSLSPARLQFTAPEITRIELLTTAPRLLGVHDTMEGQPQQFIFVNDWTKLGTGGQ